MYVVLFILVFAHPSLAQLESVDDIYDAYIGKNDHRRLFTPKTFMEGNKDFLNGTDMKVRILNDVIRISKPEDHVTPQPIEPQIPEIPMEYLKQRLRKIYLKKLVETTISPIPDFSNGGDDPAIMTRRFQEINKKLRQQEKPNLRQVYFDTESWNIPRLQSEKKKSTILMSQFVYAIRYKLPYLQLLRKKYKNFHKYKIGFCFGLMRTLVEQQHIIFSSLHFYNVNFTNLMIHMKLYEKVVRIDVDIQDLAKYIRILNYRKNIAADPDYYEENSDELQMAANKKRNLFNSLTTPSHDGPTSATTTTDETQTTVTSSTSTTLPPPNLNGPIPNT